MELQRVRRGLPEEMQDRARKEEQRRRRGGEKREQRTTLAVVDAKGALDKPRESWGAHGSQGEGLEVRLLGCRPDGRGCVGTCGIAHRCDTQVCTWRGQMHV